MATASETAMALVNALLDQDQEAVAGLLSPNVDWLENGLPHEEHYEEQDGRSKWEGGHAELDVNFTEVCADDTSAVLEVRMSHGDVATQGCAVFKVADGKVTLAHWYGDPNRAVRVLWPESAAAA
jgi:SnoaL-like domain